MPSILERLKAEKKRLAIQIKLNEIPKEIKDKVVVDVEHDELGGFVLIGVLFPPNPTVYCYDNCNSFIISNFRNLQIIGHNVITDVDILNFWGIKTGPIYWDTMLIGHLLDSSLKDYSLKTSVKRQLGIEYPTYDEIVGKRTEKQKKARITLDQQDPELVRLYNACDVFSTWRLYTNQRTVIGR